ncbi:hypothetical protein QUA71_08845 [Microcoleus sp. MON1_C5]|uniref:hypothetical protein n=1 Tax=Microcoleus sp. MON1_C5 TaxID=2818828 RepID=UPI002FD112ED
MLNPLCAATSAVKSLVFKLKRRSTFARTAAAKIGVSLASIIAAHRDDSSSEGSG